jgi:hypothetical protein
MKQFFFKKIKIRHSAKKGHPFQQTAKPPIKQPSEKGEKIYRK